IVIPKGTTVAISLNAVWEVNTEDAYWNIVDFDDNGSDSGDITNELYVAPGKKISEAEKGSFPSDPTKDHYVFDGWKVDGTETKYADSDAAKNAEPEASITLVAQWKVNTADTIYWNTVAFDDNDSTSGAISDILYVAPDKKISEAEKGSFPSDPAKTHYIFDGWKVDGTNTKYADSAAAKDAVPTGDITLVAQWKVDTTNTEYWAKVSFNTNGGSTAPAPVYVSYGNADPALDGTWPSDPTRAGYTFSGWFDGESRYDDSTILTIEADTTVVAKWTIDEDATKPGTSDPVWATVSFNANGGTGAPSDILYNTTEKKLADGVSFPTAKPSLTGYTFANWNTKANGKGSIVTGESNLSTITGNTTLYAIWNANGNTDYKVEHYLVDASGSASLKETSNHTAKTDTTANATAKTYEHYTLNSAHSSAVASGNVSGDGSLVLKLYYGINHNVVSYSVTGTVPEGAPAAPAASDVAYGQTVNVAQALAFDGYTFSGWTADGVSGASFTMPDSDVAFTGSWTLIDNGGGDNGDTGGQNDGNDDENGNDDDDTVVDEPKEPKADTPKPATTNTKVTRTPAPATPATAQATIAAAAAEQGIPTFGIGGNEIPLVAPFGVDSWSLANMLFMLAALVFAIYTTIAVARRRKYVYEMGEDSSANPRYGLFAITIAMAIASVVLFFTTQDLTQGMALVDVVSPEFVVALAVNVIAAKKVLPKIDGSLI
ncbi:MAG: InlB B-repeat-containing protein, partial [Clostridiales Family XIII bacterium]|nr:InlB B-repeat-containing protein [Clostridiales Family XIII bacterium]